MNNPLLQTWDTPYGTPPFDLIKISHFKPAVEEAIKEAALQIEAIASDPGQADFSNTVEALDNAGEKLGNITAVLFNLNNAETCKELQAVAQELSPLLARFSNDITMNDKLFRRVSAVYESRHSSGFTTEEMMLLEKHYRNFILGGAGLSESGKKRFREISEELSLLSVRFEENILEDTNLFELHLTHKEDLTGLPEGVVEAAASEAKNRGKKGWVFTLHSPGYVPFMKYSDKRELREKMFRAYSSRAYHNDEHDNRELACKIANLRLEMANILGFKTYAELALNDRMAENTPGVMSFLQKLYAAAMPAAQKDLNAVREFALRTGHQGRLEKWDWAYYSEKLQKAEFDIDDEILKPYFSLENVEKAVFSLASRLYNITFVEDRKIQAYHHEVKRWRVTEENGSLLAILYIDYFPRPGKSGGAWMTNFREQKIIEGSDIRPQVSIVTNFTRPGNTKPSLLSFSELTTFLHEFGHALHGMLSKCRFSSLSGTNVTRDFVELPSQFMENYAFEKDWLSEWAVHYLTGEPIRDELIDKIKASSTFNEGYACNRQIGFAFLDMAWHTITKPFDREPEYLESEALSGSELFPPVEGTNMSVSFGHIFGGGYAAGYYGYKWAEVLDADAFSLLREKGIFDKETAASFRHNILERGGSDKPMNLYVKFRGREPSPEAFLERSGLK
ncbi:MAG: M3 family metallopeptidase [Bacteroidales bacterium]|nr:M3 family metallopeptidase [Bacteroidales bacterium]